MLKAKKISNSHKKTNLYKNTYCYWEIYSYIEKEYSTHEKSRGLSVLHAQVSLIWFQDINYCFNVRTVEESISEILLLMSLKSLNT